MGGACWRGEEVYKMQVVLVPFIVPTTSAACLYAGLFMHPLNTGRQYHEKPPNSSEAPSFFLFLRAEGL